MELNRLNTSSESTTPQLRAIHLSEMARVTRRQFETSTTNVEYTSVSLHARSVAQVEHIIALKLVNNGNSLELQAQPDLNLCKLSEFVHVDEKDVRFLLSVDEPGGPSNSAPR